LTQFQKHVQRGLPDGTFSHKKSQFGFISKCLGKDNVGKFYGHWEYFADIWNILWSFGIFCGHFAFFSLFGMLRLVKSGNPASSSSFLTFSLTYLVLFVQHGYLVLFVQHGYLVLFVQHGYLG
jgi:hypothetical protein